MHHISKNGESVFDFQYKVVIGQCEPHLYPIEPIQYAFSSMDTFPSVGLKLLLTTTSDMPNAKRRHQFVSVSQQKKKRHAARILNPTFFCAKQGTLHFFGNKMVDREPFYK